MKTKIEYKGPSIHDRSLSRKDFEAAGIEFPEDTKFTTLRWGPGEARRPVVLGDEVPDSVQTAIVDLLSNDKTFTITSEGDLVSEADPNADHVNPDGSDVNGAGGSEVLAEAISPTDTKAGKTRSNR